MPLRYNRLIMSLGTENREMESENSDTTSHVADETEFHGFESDNSVEGNKPKQGNIADRIGSSDDMLSRIISQLNTIMASNHITLQQQIKEMINESSNSMRQELNKTKQDIVEKVDETNRKLRAEINEEIEKIQVEVRTEIEKVITDVREVQRNVETNLCRMAVFQSHLIEVQKQSDIVNKRMNTIESEVHDCK